MRRETYTKKKNKRKEKNLKRNNISAIERCDRSGDGKSHKVSNRKKKLNSICVSWQRPHQKDANSSNIMMLL